MKKITKMRLAALGSVAGMSSVLMSSAFALIPGTEAAAIIATSTVDVELVGAAVILVAATAFTFKAIRKMI